MENTTKPNLLTIPQAAELINGLSVHGLRQLCKQGKMPFIAFNTRKLIEENVLYETINAMSREIPEYKPQKSNKNKNKAE